MPSEQGEANPLPGELRKLSDEEPNALQDRAVKTEASADHAVLQQVVDQALTEAFKRYHNDTSDPTNHMIDYIIAQVSGRFSGKTVSCTLGKSCAASSGRCVNGDMVYSFYQGDAPWYTGPNSYGCWVAIS